MLLYGTVLYGYGIPGIPLLLMADSVRHDQLAGAKPKLEMAQACNGLVP